MDTSTMLANLQVGSAIMFIGMGVVFAFLVIMIMVMNLSAVVIKILNKYFPEEIPQKAKASKKKSKNDDEEIAIAIAAVLAKTQNNIA